ncbi:LruC domain-containing protein [Pedobacter sp. SYSU D00535]|uniref:LruC domain-containing protein n=1 Tax=Pedobacter sp. SYSU D00535 TaxID=2810308 RepID=UPI001A96C96E|nr:LruC domain-containing protein [Pedobacter sp. SYSU D00535]
MKTTNSTKWRHSVSVLGFALLAVFGVVSCSDEEIVNAELNSQSLSAKKNSSSLMLNEVPEPCISRCLVAGQHTNVGSVDVAVNSGGDILVTYRITKPNIYLLEIHTDVFKSIEQFKQEKKLSNGGATPGKFAFKQSWSASAKVTNYTVTIPKSYVDKYLGSTRCLNIATHAALSNGETAWGGLCADSPKGVTLDKAKQFPGKNWSVYFEFCMDECKDIIDFTYAWEDKRNNQNDADYNDMVVQADVIKTPGELKLTFLATARGASYDHKFKIRIPKQGITGVFGQNGEPQNVVSSGSDYIITVFESTKTALPAGNAWGFANTMLTEKCAPFAYKELVLTVDNSFPYNPAKPYIPFITVYTSGNVQSGPGYDLSIFELSGRDTWVDPSGKVYPNGILIPKDWRWPIEKQHIKGPYPNFSQPNWANYLADPSLTFNKSRCN